MTRKILRILGLIAALTAVSGTAAAGEAELCELAADDPDLSAISPLSAEALEQLLARARPAAPPVCLADGVSDPRCRAQSPGDAPTRSAFDPLEHQNRLAPERLALAEPTGATIRFARAPVRATCAGYARGIDRPPQA